MANPMFPVPKEARSSGATDVKFFAGLAMQAILMQKGIPEPDSAREEVALWAFRMGQAMVATDHHLHASD